MRPYDAPILSRLLVRVAILLASLAWAGFVFTQTVGDPGRGERIAAAVLEDQDARAEVVAPITASVMRTYGLPVEQQPLVAGQVDRILTDPAGARSFVDPFAGSWARLLGEDDPRPAEFDLAPLLAQFGATAGVDGAAVPDRLPVPGVPLPRTRLDWMDGVRTAVSAAVLPLVVAAAVLFAIAFAVGDRARVLRRLGIWAMLAGMSWVVVPPLLVWLARRWAPGADAVAAAALDEAVSGLLPVAIALVGGGTVALVGSFAVRPERTAARGPAPHPRREAAPSPAARPAMPSTAPAAAARRRTVAPTAEIPVVTVDPTAPPTEPIPTQSLGRRPGERVGTDDEAGVDGDPLWDYYGSS